MIYRTRGLRTASPTQIMHKSRRPPPLRATTSESQIKKSTFDCNLRLWEFVPCPSLSRDSYHSTLARPGRRHGGIIRPDSCRMDKDGFGSPKLIKASIVRFGSIQ
ncbi:hypothetical protein J6590_004377 [Homalodisca vitripennis]|nr:hypothetical protein J6590_004377 [Homalodisca vitripennis]